jgi:tetratricopeptide (TPR) repeat protein
MAAETIQSLEEALSICRENGDRLTASKLYEQMGGIWLGLGDYAKADAATDARIAMLGGFAKPLTDLAISFMIKGILAWAQGDYVTAKALYEESYRRLEQASPDDLRLYTCLFNMARIERDLGNYERSWCLYNQVLQWAEERPFRGGHVLVAYVLTGFACLASVTEQPEQAVRLAGAADAQLEYYQRRLDRPDDLAYQRDLAVAREQLSEQAFTTLHTEGRQMSRNEAIAYAHQFTLR